jgi:selT/selW/selH-like putative selenoprotein
MNTSVSIRYCRTCGFGEPAEQIAETLRRELAVSVECRPGFWGSFRIELDGEVLFNRWTSHGWLSRLGFGRTPTPREIVNEVRRRLQRTTVK